MTDTKNKNSFMKSRDKLGASDNSKDLDMEIKAMTMGFSRT